jgi:hypothetical protein
VSRPPLAPPFTLPLASARALPFALAVALSGCAPQVANSPAPPIAATQQKGNPGRRARLGWVSWQDAESIIYCNRRVDDNGGPIGVLGPCSQLGADGTPHRLVSWLNSESPDRSNSDATPLAGCTLEQEDAQLAPQPKPARVFITGKSGRTLLDEWSPDHARLTADAYSIEPSFGPDGKTIALLHLAVGLGEGERTIEIPSATLRPAPDCK